MNKNTQSRRGFYLRASVFFVVCALLGSSVIISLGNSHDNALLDSKVVGNNSPLSQNSNFNTGYVEYTLMLNNDTLISGNINISNESFLAGMTFDSSNGYVYVANSFSGKVLVINGSDNTVIDNIAAGLDPQGIEFDPSNGNVYVANIAANNISVISGSSENVVANIPVGRAPVGVAFDASNGYLYVGNSNSSNVSVINGKTNAVIDSVSMSSEPQGITYDSSNQNIYVVTSDSVSVINGANNTVIANIPVGGEPLGLAYDPSNGFVYVGDSYSDNVSVINGKTNAVISNIAVGSHPEDVMFDPSNEYLYVVNVMSNNVSVINGANNTVIANIPVGGEPLGLAYDPSNGFVYIDNSGSGTVSIISTEVGSKAMFPVTFTEFSLPSGTPWSVTVNGTFESSTTNTLTFSLSNGTHYYTVGSVSGYTSSITSSSVTVNGHSDSIGIVFEKVNVGQQPDWAFSGAYVNYSVSGTNASSKFSGYAFLNIYSANSSTGMVNSTLSFVAPGSGISGLEYFNESWNYYPLAVNGTTLDALNHGIMPQQLNESLDSPYQLYTSVPLTTVMGTFTTDEIVVPAPHGGAPILTNYINQYSGVLMKDVVREQNGYGGVENTTLLIQSTNIPMASASSILDLSVSPAGSSVLVNGIPVALSTGHANISLTPGTYYVSASEHGYSPSFREVNLSSGKVSYLNITLSQSTASTYFLSGYVTPGNASVVVGENIAYVNPSGYYNISLPVGNYTISVSGSGYYPSAKYVNLTGNIRNENITLVREPVPTSSKSAENVTATGYNVTVSNLTSGNGSISLNYTSAPNGTVTVVIPYSQMGNVTVSEILNSRVYVNGTRYTDFTVAISSQDGTYSVILTVYNLTGDPTLAWLYSPSASLPTGQKSSPPLSPYILDIGVIIALATIASVLIMVSRRKR